MKSHIRTFITAFLTVAICGLILAWVLRVLYSTTMKTASSTITSTNTTKTTMGFLADWVSFAVFWVIFVVAAVIILSIIRRYSGGSKTRITQIIVTIALSVLILLTLYRPSPIIPIQREPPPYQSLNPEALLFRIVKVTHSPIRLVPGDKISFEADLIKNESLDFYNYDERVKVWWLGHGNSYSSDPGPGTGCLPAGIGLSDIWTVPGEGAGIYMAYAYGDTNIRGTGTVSLVALSDIGTFTTGNVSVVFNSSLIHLGVEKKGEYVKYPCSRIIARIAEDEGFPAVTDLRFDVHSWVLEGYPYPPSWRQVEEYSYIHYPDPPPETQPPYMGCGSAYDYHENLDTKGRFRVNGTEDDESFLLVHDPEERRRDPLGPVHSTGTGLFIIWMAGWDKNGTIHFARPLIFISPIPENLPPPPPVCMEWGPRVKILKVWHEPTKPGPGDEVTFHAECNTSAERLSASFYWFAKQGDQQGGWNGAAWRSTTMPEEPCFGFYQSSIYSNQTWSVSSYHPILVPEDPYVKDSDMIVLRAEKIGNCSMPFAKVIATVKDKSIKKVYCTYHVFHRCGGRGPSTNLEMAKEGDNEYATGHVHYDPYGLDPIPQNITVLISACGKDKKGVMHYSKTLRYSIGDPGPFIFNP